MKKSIALLLVLLLSVSMLFGCGNTTTPPATETVAPTSAPVATSAPAPAESAVEIYFLNFKPEIADVYAEIAAVYEAETGVKVKVDTAASGTYENILMSEIAKSEPPTIFQLNGPVGYQKWKEYCLDLSGSGLYSILSDKSLAIQSGSGVYGVPYAVEGYGIIYNDAIMQKYFALEGAVVTSTDAINSFATLKAVVEDMQAKKDALSIEGVFASTSMAAGNAWRWETHLANVPLYYEFKDNTAFDNAVLAGLAANEITFKYGENYKNIFDLYTENSVSKKGLLSNISVDDAMAEFALGRCAMVQNGNWGASQILGVTGNTVADADIKFLPIYIGVPGEESQGLCIGTENYFAINSTVSPEKQQASIDFLVWLFSSSTGKGFVKDKLGFIAPFTTFEDTEKPSDPLSKEVLAWMEKAGVSSVPWAFAAFPSQAFKDYFADALLEYLQGSKAWADVSETVITQWKSERALNPVG